MTDQQQHKFRYLLPPGNNFKFVAKFKISRAAFDVAMRRTSPVGSAARAGGRVSTLPSAPQPA